jgi:hypothetical protein
MRIVDDHEVTLSEMITRLIFGAIFGGVVSAGVSYKYDFSSLTTWVFSTVVICGCAVLSLVQGDRFWISMFGAGRNR